MLLTMNDKEKLFNKAQNGDFQSMNILVESYFYLVDEYVEQYSKKHKNIDSIDLTRYIKSMLFRRMQICSSIFSYEKDAKKLIQREAIKYQRNLNIKNKKENFNFIDLEVDEKILKVLNDLLEPDVYYVFYQMISGIDISIIAKKLDVSLLEIRKKYIHALEMLDLYMDKDSQKLKRRLYTINWREGNKSKRIKIVPYSIDSIIIYFYLKDCLTEEERKLYYYQIFSKYDYYQNELETLLGTNEDLEIISASLNQKINECVSKNDYQEFYEKMVKNYGPYLYNLVKSENVKKFDFASINQVINLLGYDDIKKFLSDDFTYITPSEKKLLYKYFYRGLRYNAEVEDIERDVNLNIFGYKQKKSDILPKKYYQTYLENKDSFDESQQLFLECYFFKTRDKEEFLKQYPDSSLYYRYYNLTERLEKLYYNINNFTDNTFNREKWLSIRDRYKAIHKKERVELLDLFYGVSKEPMTIKEIASLYPGLSYVKVHDLVSDARLSAINIYINKKHKIDISPEDYIPFLDKKYDYTDETRLILTYFLRDKLNYEEIKNLTGLNKTRISNIITDGIRKIDHYRLGILKTRPIDETVLTSLYEEYPDSFSKDHKEIFSLRFISGHSNDKIATILNIDKKEVNKAISHLYHLYDRYLAKNTTLTISDVRNELNLHFTESVLSEREKEVLSLFYGIKNEFNKEGEQLQGPEIASRLGISLSSYHHLYFTGNDKVKLHKIHAIEPDMYVFSRHELIELLEDQHLPISDKERDIICSLWAINGHEYKTIDELSIIHNELSGSIRRRYYRAMVNIKKYLNGEIEEQLNYEIDIVPNLKYFSKSDRVYIYEYFKEGRSYKEIAKKYNITPEMFLAIINRIKITLFEMTHQENVKNLFDFDYYYEAIEDPSLPFYGDLKNARAIFELYFGMNEMRRLSIPEIQKRLNLSWQTSAINRAVYSIMISVCKLREGIKKQNEFSFEEITDYYNRHVSEMDSVHRVYYERYFKKMKSVKDLNGKVTRVPEMITYDLLKEKQLPLFHIKTATREEISRILNDKNYILDSKTRHTLSEMIHPYGDLDGRDINHVYRIINSLLERNLLFIDKGKSYRLKIEEQ